jgi:hypothetical protein
MRVRITGRAVARVLAAGTVAVTALAACKPAPPANTFEARARQVQRTAPDTRPWFCNAAGTGSPPAGHGSGTGNGAHVHPYYEGKVKGPLSWPDCIKLAQELDLTAKAVKGLETKAKGEAAGWREAAPYIPGLGTHHVKFGGGTTPGGTVPGGGDIQKIVACLREQGLDFSGGAFPDFNDPAVQAAFKACNVPVPTGGAGGIGGGVVNQPFDPAKPQILIYGGDAEDSPLVGVGYMFAGSDKPPEAYTGGNDWWHKHTKICAGIDFDRAGSLDPEHMTEEECRALGGTLRELFPGSGGQAGGIWLLHMWPFSPYEYRPDLFVSGHPCLGPDGAVPQTDACWAQARIDPSKVPSTTTPGHGHPTTTVATPTTGAPPTTAAPPSTLVPPSTAAPTTAAPTTAPPTTVGHGNHGH